jgi:hypothetical protein
MKTLFLLLFSFNLFAQNECPSSADTIVVGDSQVGATWSRTYTGNYLQKCLKGDFYIYGRGATSVSSWIGKGSLDKIETIERSRLDAHKNIGKLGEVPLCKKRIEHILSSHRPLKIVFNFGGNMIRQTDQDITNQITRLMTIVSDHNIKPVDCYFITPTFEMEVESNRNVPVRNLESVTRVTNLIKNSLNRQCTLLSGLEIMKSSPYFDGKELLKREIIPTDGGCGGAAKNDNVHICGKAAQDYANRLCDLIN